MSEVINFTPPYTFMTCRENVIGKLLLPVPTDRKAAWKETPSPSL
jgi:hypothetical protein